MPSSPSIGCPVCHAPSGPVFTVHGHDVLECADCEHRFIAQNFDASHVAAIYGDDYFFGGGAGYPDYIGLADAAVAHGRYYAGVVSRHAPPGRMLDVGAAAGFVLKGFAERGWQVSGVEPNKRMAYYGRDMLGLDIRVGAVEDFTDPDRFDLVSMIQVIGHFYDLERAMKAVDRLTRPGGHCLIEFWDRGSLPARVLNKAWHEYSPPSVLHWFKAADLILLLDGVGFRPIARGKPKKYIMGSHVKSLLAYKVRSWPLGGVLARTVGLIPNKMRLRYPAFDLEWILFRKDR